jgi:hypothetical protein
VKRAGRWVVKGLDQLRTFGSSVPRFVGAGLGDDYVNQLTETHRT